MRKDCPHCGIALDGPLANAGALAEGRERACPVCGRALALRLHPLEMLLTALICPAFLGLYAAESYLTPDARNMVLAGGFVAVALGAALYLRLTRDWQRFRSPGAGAPPAP
ncbi:MAG: hypothetical protein V4582_16865 [Pseudomonadota bacterium]